MFARILVTGEGGGDAVQFHNIWGREERHGEKGFTGLLSGWLCGETLGTRRQGCTLPVRLNMGARLWVGCILLDVRSWGVYYRASAMKVDAPRREDSASFSSGASYSPSGSLPRLDDWDASMSVAVRAARWVAVRGA